MARLAYQFAAQSERVQADVVEASEFPELARRYAVRAVPKSVINDGYELLGAIPEAELLKMVLQAAGADAPEEPAKA
jgi:predicted DsbA family dithiol-disulfide isomerase